jgi:hypothetical protein
MLWRAAKPSIAALSLSISAALGHATTPPAVSPGASGADVGVVAPAARAVDSRVVAPSTDAATRATEKSVLEGREVEALRANPATSAPSKTPGALGALSKIDRE